MAVATSTSTSDNTAPPSQSMDTTSATDHSTAVEETPMPVYGSSSAGLVDPVDYSVQSPISSRLIIQPSLRSEEYRQLFRLPPEEILIQDFNCALQENFILQGHMYLFIDHICFYSNLFGFETKKIISFDEITSVKRAKTAGIFPTAIEITASDKKFFFSSFLSRDEAFKLINDGLVEHGNACKAASDQQETRSEFIDDEPEIVAIEDSYEPGQLRDDLETTNGITDDYTREHPNGSPVIEGEVPVTSSRVQDAVDEDTLIVQNTDCSSFGKALAWEADDTEAPHIPEDYKLVAESKFPIKVDEFFRLFFSDESLPFLKSYHNKCGDKDLTCTSWKPHDQLGYTREVSFQHPIKIYFGARFGSCNEVQNFRVYKNSHLVLKTSQVVNDVPYGDYFSVEGIWDVEADSSGGCTLKVYVNLAFSKKTMWKGKIVTATVEECRDTFAAFIELATTFLKQKNINKEANMIPVEAPVCAPDQLETPQTVPQLQEVPPVSTSLQGPSSDSATAASFFRDSVPKIFSSFKSRNQVPSFVVILMAVVILLMQISIVVLLLRPQSVQVVSDSAWMSNTRIDRRGETVSLLNKQIDHLKDEMFIVETLLEKMKHEHDMLTVQLKNLLLRKS